VLGPCHAIHQVIGKPNPARIAHHDNRFPQTRKNNELNAQLFGKLHLHSHKILAVAFAEWVVEQQEASIL
jgi:hypothetical protein